VGVLYGPDSLWTDLVEGWPLVPGISGVQQGSITALTGES
jgi:hypothetical protein